jgi:hypothetical protein
MKERSEGHKGWGFALPVSRKGIEADRRQCRMMAGAGRIMTVYWQFTLPSRR